MAILVYARSGDKITRKYRCTTGRRTGKLVGTPTQCYAPLDFKKRANMRRLHKTRGKTMALKRKRTKLYNPVSKQVSRMNRIIRRK